MSPRAPAASAFQWLVSGSVATPILPEMTPPSVGGGQVLEQPGLAEGMLALAQEQA